MTFDVSRVMPVAEVLMDWAAKEEGELSDFEAHIAAATIVFADEFQFDGAGNWLAEMMKAAKAAADLRGVLEGLTPWQLRVFAGGMTESDAYPDAMIEGSDPAANAESFNRWHVEQAIRFLQAIEAGARNSRAWAEAWLRDHPAQCRNAEWRNRDVTAAVAEFYSGHTHRDPPRSGKSDGPFQRLLKDVFTALGRPNVDLRGPMNWLHAHRNS